MPAVTWQAGVRLLFFSYPPLYTFHNFLNFVHYITNPIKIQLEFICVFPNFIIISRTKKSKILTIFKKYVIIIITKKYERNIL